jgi:hypothetical protein
MAIINDKAALLGAAPRKQEVVTITGGEVLVVEIGAVEYMRMLEECQGDMAEKPIVHIVASWATITEAGDRLFTVEDFAQLDRTTQLAIGNAAMKLNWTAGDEKNAEAGQESDSPSGSL